MADRLKTMNKIVILKSKGTITGSFALNPFSNSLATFIK